MKRSRAFPLLALALLLPAPAGGQMLPREAAVKAAFITKFGAYVGWPAAAGDRPLVVCAVGRDALGDALPQAITGQTVGGRALTYRRLASIGKEDGCDIAYLAGSAQQSVSAGLAATVGTPVLTITDSRWGGARGTIHFQLAGGRVRFHIDDAEAASRGLSISSRLLSLALSVRERNRRR